VSGRTRRLPVHAARTLVPAQVAYLRVLRGLDSTGQGLTIAELDARADVQRPLVQVGRIVAGLVDLGLVRRYRAPGAGGERRYVIRHQGSDVLRVLDTPADKAPTNHA
jgi:predicted transcriptional regulator